MTLATLNFDAGPDRPKRRTAHFRTQGESKAQ